MTYGGRFDGGCLVDGGRLDYCLTEHGGWLGDGSVGHRLAVVFDYRRRIGDG
jgi:hypothetical protein